MTATIRSVRSFHREKHIFCIEGSWEHDHRDKKSVDKALEFLTSIEEVRTITKKCYNSATLNELLKDSMQSKYKKYAILYLAFHGEPNAIHLGKRGKKARLPEIAEVLQGRANGKIVHFGCCSTLNVSGWDCRRFLRETGALAISGYKKDIDFIKSTAFDLLYFQQCQRTVDIRVIKRNMTEYYKKLGDELGFVIKHW